MSLDTPNKKNICSYCGDAPVHHKLSFFGSSISMFLDPFFAKTSGWIPQVFVDGVDVFLKALFYILYFLKIIKLSDDINLAVTLRSRVGWEEAKRRGIKMEQIIVFGKPTDNYRAKINGKYIYFDSLPLPQKPFSFKENWDDKFFLKERFIKENIPVPLCVEVPFSKSSREILFNKLRKPLIVKPRVGSRGRHTTINISEFETFEKALRLAGEICPKVVTEEYLEGYVCRATCVDGKLVGFYRAQSPLIIGDGVQTIGELINQKNKNRPDRIEKINIGKEIEDYLAQLDLKTDDILQKGKEIKLSHRTGRYFGGITKEMLDELHPSFVPVLEKAAQITTLSLVGFDCVIPDPEKSESEQRWGFIEGNTMPFIDLHYYAFSGKSRNIAGMIWELWK